MSGALKKGITRTDGNVEFQTVRNGAYSVVVAPQGGFDGRHECLDRVGLGVAYSLLELRADLTDAVVLLEPALPHPRSTGAIPLGEFCGIYADSGAQLYQVVLLDAPTGVALSLPNSEFLRFPNRDGLVFRSSEATLSFRIDHGRVAGFTLARTRIEARKRE